MPVKEFNKMVKKRCYKEKTVVALRSEGKAKSLFTLTTGKTPFESREEETEEEAFARYNVID
jgi:hypothetical protein